MAGALAVMAKGEEEAAAEKNPSMAIRQRFQWQAKYSRCFNFPSSLSSADGGGSPHHLLCPLKRSLFKPVWLSSAGFASVSLLPSAAGDSRTAVLAVALQGTIIEEHFVSKLHFTWPQVSCVSGFPSRGSLVVLASYCDDANEKQKLAFRFSTVSEVEDFINSLEHILSNRVSYDELPAVDVMSAISSESESVPPYRPGTSGMLNPSVASSTPKGLHTKDQHDSQNMDIVPYPEGNDAQFPPGFMSLMSTCSTEIDQDTLDLKCPTESGQLNLKDQIAKFMQDASFLDVVNKVDEVISDLGGGFSL